MASTRSELKGRGGLPFELEQAVCQGEIGTGISGASKRVPIFLHDVGKKVSFYFGQELKQTGELEPSLGGLARLRPRCRDCSLISALNHSV